MNTFTNQNVASAAFASGNPLQTFWFEPEHALSQYLDATMQLLSKISQYPYVAYCYDTEDKQYLKTRSLEIALSHVDIHPVVEISSDNLHLSEPCQQVTLDTPIFHCMQQYFSRLGFNAIQSLSILKLSIEECLSPITIFLFSEHEHHLNCNTWECLQQYLQQRIQGLKQLIENHTLQQQVQELQDINQGRAKYFSVIAHDLRAPFHGILGCADILAHERDTLDDAAAQRLADYIHDTAQSTHGLLENLLNWAMAEGGRFHVKPSHFEVSEMLQSVVNLLQSFAFKKQIQIQCDFSTPLYAYADARMMASVLQNIISNALKFTAAANQKSMFIKAHKNQNWVEIMIQDEGIGMTPEQMQQLFQPQNTTPSTLGTTGEKGTGLGLILCKRFMDLNQGTIMVESKENHGTCFTVRLPIGHYNV